MAQKDYHVEIDEILDRVGGGLDAEQTADLYSTLDGLMQARDDMRLSRDYHSDRHTQAVYIAKAAKLLMDASVVHLGSRDEILRHCSELLTLIN